MILSAIALLLILSMSFLDAGIRSSSTSAESSVSAYSTGNPDNLLYNDIILYVHREEALDTKLETELVEAFEENGISVTLSDEIKDDYGSQFVFVNIIDVARMYTPVYSKSDIDIRFGFSSSGKTEYLDIEGQNADRTVVFSSDGIDSYQLLIQGNMHLKDETKGLYTYRSYQDHIARELANTVASELASRIKGGV
ncbi:hypothetical protein [Methanolobus sp. WCC5]|uniref:hypothetical protein n=1 Tax=Methanolobus sp. WCC5 TaxID=3125785 RepID=UPI003254436D